MGSFPTKILLATDGSADATLAAQAAIDMSNGMGSELHIMHAWHSIPTARFESYIRSQLKQEAQEMLTEQVERVKASGGEIAETHLRKGSTVDEILNLAETLDIELIVIGSRGFNPMKRLVLGSVSEGVVHHARCPVLVVRGGPDVWSPKRIVIGDDGSEAAKGAGELAASIGKLFGVRGLLMRVYPQLPEVNLEGRRLNARVVDDELRREEKALEERASQIEEYLGSRPTIRVDVGDAATELLEAAEEGDAPEKVLLAVGSRGLGAIRRIRLGSISTKVLYAAKGPVLIYRHHRG